MGKAKAAGGILSALGTLLPGAAGAAAQQAALPIAQTTGKVGAAQFRAQSQLAAVENVAGKVRKGAPLAAPAAPAAGVPAAAAFAGPYGAAGAAGRPNRASVPRAPAAGTPRPPVPDSWLRTPVVAPNETLRLDLLITVVKARPAWPYVFKVCSRPVEPEEAAPVIEEGTLQLAGIAWWRRLESYGLYLLGSAIAGQLVWWLWTRLGILG
jgi:hypothetical protein